MTSGPPTAEESARILSISADGAAAIAIGRRKEDALEFVCALFAVVRLCWEPGYSVPPIGKLLLDLSIVPLLVVVPSSLDTVLSLHPEYSLTATLHI